MADGQDTRPDDTARFALRRRFFAILDEEAPEVRENLLQIWQAFAPRFTEIKQARLLSMRKPVMPGRPSLSPIFSFLVWFKWRRDPNDEDLQRFERQLQDWARRHNLTEPWIMESALVLMECWSINPNNVTDTWSPPSADTSILPVDDEYFLFSESWDPFRETREQARHRVKAAFDEQLQSWLDQAQQRAEELGLPKLPKKRELDQHLRWLVRHQVLDEDFVAIAKSDKRAEPEFAGRKAVSSAVAETAKVLGLTLRQSKPGKHPRAD